MAEKRRGAKPAMTDAKVREGTGKTWKEWFSLLDPLGATMQAHRATAHYLEQEHGLDGWWADAVAEAYARKFAETTGGEAAEAASAGVPATSAGAARVGTAPAEAAEIGGPLRLDLRRTIAAPSKKVWEALTDPKLLSKWFTTRAKVDLQVGGRYSNGDGDEGAYLAIEPRRRLRFSWENRKYCPDTVVEVGLTAQGKGMVDVRLTHSKLRSKQDREEMKEGWSWAMDSLKSFLETGEPIRHADWVDARKAAATRRAT